MNKFEHRKQAIVRAAVDVINRKGVRGMTLGEVAAQLGLVPSAVGYYFRKKEELAAVYFLASIAQFEAFLDSASEGESPEARVRLYLRAFLDFWAKVARGEAEPIILFNEVRTIGDPEVNLAYLRMYRRVRSLLDRGPGERHSRIERNARAHLLLTEAIWLTLWTDRFDPRDFGRVGERMFDIFAHGIAAEGRGWSNGWLPAPPSEASSGDLSPAAFLKAATELINDQGYRGASVAKIASRLNVTKGAFYHHLDAKHDLVEACFERTLNVLREVQEAAEAEGGDGLERLCTATGTLFRHQVSGEVPLLRISALAAVSETIGEDIFREFSRISLHFAGIVSDGIADGSIRPVDPNVAGFMITAMISGATELDYWLPGVTPDNAAAAFARPFFEGLFCSPAS
jgi:AcrR family transcriptional regulator